MPWFRMCCPMRGRRFENLKYLCLVTFWLKSGSYMFLSERLVAFLIQDVQLTARFL